MNADLARKRTRQQNSSTDPLWLDRVGRPTLIRRPWSVLARLAKAKVCVRHGSNKQMRNVLLGNHTTTAAAVLFFFFACEKSQSVNKCGTSASQSQFSVPLPQT